MSSVETKIKTVPRVQHLGYLREGLRSIKKGASLDELRVHLHEASRELTKRRFSDSVSNMIMDRFTNWSPPVQVARTLMQLKLIESAKLPSKRTFFDEYRELRFSITEFGEALVRDAESGLDRFLMTLTPMLLEHYQPFHAFLKMASEHPIFIPEYSEDDLLELQKLGADWLDRLALDATRKIKEHGQVAELDPAFVTDALKRQLEGRFGSDAEPARRHQLDTLNDALIGIATGARGERLDAVTWDTLRSWGESLFITCESRYVLGYPPGRVTWVTCEFDETYTKPRRRGLSSHAGMVVEELAKSYRSIADERNRAYGGSRIKYPLVEIYRVRALTSFNCKVNSQLVDKVIAEVRDGRRAADYRVDLSEGIGRWTATSEMPFTLNNIRYYVMVIKPEGDQGDK